MDTVSAQTTVSTRWAKTEECWVSHRDIIERLYLEENKTLKEVMEKMEREYKFKATYVHH
jgi:hypothetical protein